MSFKGYWYERLESVDDLGGIEVRVIVPWPGVGVLVGKGDMLLSTCKGVLSFKSWIMRLCAVFMSPLRVTQI